ncbi:hypothetical protein NQ318_011841 [Aromia moschata]|uniref:Uncharacterized protein n=1 Tax=Aromia moschata TaxID=1265417 RepID=A0AAV8XEH7_9CUCU|nr:hypothetical protein NQ318_011841 [Aromia moschata]
MDSHHGPCIADSLRLPQRPRMDSTRNGYYNTHISRGQALEILQSIPEEQQNDYDRIVGALEIRYGQNISVKFTSPKSRVDNKEPMESLQEYEADIERLILLAYPQAPKEFLEQIGIQTFIDGLLDTEMQHKLCGLGGIPRSVMYW